MLSFEIIEGSAHLSVTLCRMKSSENKYLAVLVTIKKKTLIEHEKGIVTNDGRERRIFNYLQN